MLPCLTTHIQPLLALMCTHTGTHAPDFSRLCAPAVFMDGLQLRMRPSETQQQHVLDDLDGSAAFSLNWDLQFPELGNTAEITSAFMRVVVWLSPGILPAEVSQPASSSLGRSLPLSSLKSLCVPLAELGSCLPCAHLAGQA